MHVVRDIDHIRARQRSGLIWAVGNMQHYKYKLFPNKYMESETEIESALREAFGKKSHKKILGVFILFGLSAIVLMFFYPNALPISLTQGLGIRAEDVAFVSQGDSDFQQRVKNVTGYDWTNFLDADENGKSKTAALMLLSNEISALDDNYNFVNRSAGLGKGEIGITRLNATDSSRANLLKLIGNVKSAENAFAAKGMASAKTRADRMSVIENFFGKYAMPEGAIAGDAQNLFGEKLGLSVDDYPRLVSLMIINYNLFVA